MRPLEVQTDLLKASGTSDQSFRLAPRPKIFGYY